MRWGLLAAVAASGLLALGTTQVAASTPPTVNIALTASSITVSGATESGGVNVVVSATGVKEAAAILVLLKPGVTPEELTSALKAKKVRDPNSVSKYGSIVFNAEAAGGQKTEAQTTLAAGQYLALSKEQEGPPKATASFTVKAAASPASLPAPQAVERSIDFAFTGPRTLKDGEVVRFENEGYVVHMDFAFGTKSAQSAQQLARLLLAGREKQAERLVTGAAGFAGPLSTGAYQQETITAKPGWYVQVCFMNTQDGRSHTVLGMERVIRIVK